MSNLYETDFVAPPADTEDDEENEKQEVDPPALARALPGDAFKAIDGDSKNEEGDEVDSDEERGRRAVLAAVPLKDNKEERMLVGGACRNDPMYGLFLVAPNLLPIETDAVVAVLVVLVATALDMQLPSALRLAMVPPPGDADLIGVDS